MRLSHLEQIVEFNAGRPGVVQTYTALAAESTTGQHPAREYFTERYAAAREAFAELLSRSSATDCRADSRPSRRRRCSSPMLDGMQIQWLLAPDEVDMTAAYRNFVSLLSAGDRAENRADLELAEPVAPQIGTA